MTDHRFSGRTVRFSFFSRTRLKGALRKDRGCSAEEDATENAAFSSTIRFSAFLASRFQAASRFALVAEVNWDASDIRISASDAAFRLRGRLVVDNGLLFSSLVDRKPFLLLGLRPPFFISSSMQDRGSDRPLQSSSALLDPKFNLCSPRVSFQDTKTTARREALMITPSLRAGNSDTACSKLRRGSYFLACRELFSRPLHSLQNCGCGC